jgi:hypothetical protein
MFSGNPKYQILCKHSQKFSSHDSQAEVSVLTDVVLRLLEVSEPLTDYGSEWKTQETLKCTVVNL